MKNKKEGMKELINYCNGILEDDNCNLREKNVAETVLNIIEKHGLDKIEFINNQVVIKQNDLSDENLREIADKVLKITEEEGRKMGNAITK